jgi:hypothetical protein
VHVVATGPAAGTSGTAPPRCSPPWRPPPAPEGSCIGCSCSSAGLGRSGQGWPGLTSCTRRRYLGGVAERLCQHVARYCGQRAVGGVGLLGDQVGGLDARGSILRLGAPGSDPEIMRASTVADKAIFNPTVIGDMRGLQPVSYDSLSCILLPPLLTTDMLPSGSRPRIRGSDRQGEYVYMTLLSARAARRFQGAAKPAWLLRTGADTGVCCAGSSRANHLPPVT